MRMEIRYKMILAFLLVVAVVVFVPYVFDLLGVNEGAWKEFGAACHRRGSEPRQFLCGQYDP